MGTKVNLDALTPTLFNTVQELKEAFNKAGASPTVTVDAEIGANVMHMSIYDGSLTFSMWQYEEEKGVIIRPASSNPLVRSVFNSIINEEKPYITASTNTAAVANGIELASSYAARIMKLATGK